MLTRYRIIQAGGNEVRSPTGQWAKYKDVEGLETELERLRKALEFYADPDTYFEIITSDYELIKSKGGFNRTVPGRRARAALKEEK